MLLAACGDGRVSLVKSRDCVMSSQRVRVFGGTGFLGRCIAYRSRDADFAVRIAVRHPERGRLLFSAEASDIEFARADVNDDAALATGVSGASAGGNAVSLYVEQGQ